MRRHSTSSKKRQWFCFSLRTFLVSTFVAGILIGQFVVPPVKESEVIGYWSADPELANWGHGVHARLERDRSYWVREGKFSNWPVYGSIDEPKWTLKPVNTISGRYILSFGDEHYWDIRFSRDHETMYTTIRGKEEALVKVR